MNKSEVIIDLDKIGESYGFKFDELMQLTEYQKVSEIIKSAIDRRNRHADQKTIDDIAKCQIHDTIFISGDRGSGKTTFLKNLNTYLFSDKSILDARYKKINILPIIDPTLLHENERFIIIAVSHILNFVENEFKNRSIVVSESSQRDFYNKIKEISDSLKLINTDKHDESTIERLIFNQNSLKLELRMHQLFKEVTEILSCDILILPIDDIDMSFDHGFEVLEAVRKYFSSPYILPIVSGAPKLYATIVEKQFFKKIGSKIYNENDWDSLSIEENSSNSSNKQSDSILAGFDKKYFMNEMHLLRDKYFEKVFPSENRVSLRSIQDVIILNRNLKIKSGNTSINLHEFLLDLMKSFNRPIKIKHLNSEYSYCPVPINNMRMFVQFLSAVRMTHSSESIYNFYYSHPDNKSKLIKMLALGNIMCENGDILKLLYSDLFNPSLNPNKNPKLETLDKSQLTKSKKSNYYISRESVKIKSLGFVDSFLIELFTYDDYYAIGQKKNFIVASKFIELMLFSFDKLEDDKRSKTIFDILYANKNSVKTRRQFLLDIPENNYLPELIDEEYENMDVPSDVDPENEMAGKFVEEIDSNIQYFPKYSHKLSSVFIYKVINKVQWNLNAIYKNNQKEPLIDFMRRVCWVLINSVAFFEKITDDHADISESNIATSKNSPDEKYLSKYDNAYRRNIKKLKDVDDSVTQWLYNHPLIEKIISPQSDSFQMIHLGAKSAYMKYYSKLINNRNKLDSKSIELMIKEINSLISKGDVDKIDKDIINKITSEIYGAKSVLGIKINQEFTSMLDKWPL